MPDAISFIQWDNYTHGVDGRGFFSAEPLSFSSKQERLHKVGVGERLWLVSRCPEDGQHYFVAVLKVAAQKHNQPDSELARNYGEFCVFADRTQSFELDKKLPADGLLRAFQFETGKAIKFGARIGQSLQTIRVLGASDARVLDSYLHRIGLGKSPALDAPSGLWTKCDAVFADYFWDNWQRNRQPLAFLLYDSPPVLPPGAPVFIHSDKNLRLIAAFRCSQYVAGYKPTVDAEERVAERERIWMNFRAPTINPPRRIEFDEFWDSQHGVRSLFLMENLVRVPVELQFKTYGRALEWGYPMGVGYRYVTFSQCLLLLRAAGISEQEHEPFVTPLLAG